MARIRTVKPEFFKNEELAELPVEARLLFIGLFCLADRQGKLEDRPGRIKCELCTYRSTDIDPLLQQLHDAGFITRKDGFIKVHPRDCLGTIRSYSILDIDTKAWIKLRHYLFKKQGKKCNYCGDDNGPFQIDHIVPISQGGTDEEENLLVACRKCNIRKKDMPLSVFLKKYNLSYGAD